MRDKMRQFRSRSRDRRAAFSRWIARKMGPHGWARGCAFVLSVGGWTLIWAQGLTLVELGTIWLPTAAFFLGLALIPWGQFGAAEEPATRPYGRDRATRETKVRTIPDTGMKSRRGCSKTRPTASRLSLLCRKPSETHRPGRDRDDAHHQDHEGQWIVIRPKAATQIHDTPPG